MTYKPAPLPNAVMGHVLDTEHVRIMEAKYQQKLVGYSAKWDENYRTYVWNEGQWQGVYPLTADDVELHEKRG